MGHPGPKRKKFFTNVTGRTLEVADRILYGKATWRSWKNQDYDLIGKKTDRSLFGRTDMFLWYGITRLDTDYGCSRRGACLTHISSTERKNRRRNRDVKESNRVSEKSNEPAVPRHGDIQAAEYRLDR